MMDYELCLVSLLALVLKAIKEKSDGKKIPDDDDGDKCLLLLLLIYHKVMVFFLPFDILLGS